MIHYSPIKLNDMTTTRKEKVEQLAQYSDEICISLYLPTHRYGDAVVQGKDKTVLKNQLREVFTRLSDRGIPKRKIEELTQPIQKLYGDTNFWNHQTDGLAIFASENFFETFHLPRTVRNIISISDRFHVIPMITQLEPAGDYLVLALDLKNSALYRASKTGINNITDEIEDFPRQLEDVVGYDLTPDHLQFRTQQAGPGQALYHGQGAGKDSRKSEILQFMRGVNEKLIPYLRSENIPLVFFGQEYLFPIYQEANQYQGLLKKYVALHPANLSIKEIHDKTWEVIRPVLIQKREEKITEFKRHHGTGRTVTSIGSILRTAVQGRIDTLFVPRDNDLYGTFDMNTNEVTVDDSPDSPHPSLINIAAIYTFLQGGNIYAMNRDELPDEKSRANALLRY